MVGKELFTHSSTIPIFHYSTIPILSACIHLDNLGDVNLERQSDLRGGR
jgi:hypothetical protein